MSSIIKVKESTMVYPASKTPRVSLWLSRLDMIFEPYSHTDVLYIYHHPTTNNNNNENINKNENESWSDFFNTQIIKESLSRVLVPFYPVAGRLKFNDENGRYEVDCNAKGALFIEAEASTHALADFGDYSRPDNELRKIVIPIIDYSKGLSSFPLLVVQLTRFNCGGVCLGISSHHHVGDGTSHLHFTNSWARLAKGLDLSVYPIHDRATYLGPRHPPQVKFQHYEYDHPSSFRKDFSSPDNMVKATECVFELTKGQIDALKLQVKNPVTTSCEVISTFVVLTAHVWRTACKARGLAADQDVRLYMSVDGRSRFTPSVPLSLPQGPTFCESLLGQTRQRLGNEGKNTSTLPQGYFGNVFFIAVCLEKAGVVMRKPLWYVASKIQQAIKRMEDVEYLRSAIDYLESYPDLNSLVRGPDYVTCPNLGVNSWARIPFKEVDFGWGGPNFTSIRGIKYEGQVYFIASPNEDGGILVATKLFATHKTSFKKHLYDDL